MNRTYLVSGIAAALVAVLFPVYWILEFGQAFATGELRTDMSRLDVLYFLVGGLIMFLFYSLKRYLNEQFEYRSADTLLMVIIAFTAVSYAGSFFLAQYASESVFTTFFVGTIVGAGILDIVLGILLVRAGAEVSSGIKTFAAVNICLGVTEATLILSIASIVIYPICALVLCVTFLRRPRELQIV